MPVVTETSSPSEAPTRGGGIASALNAPTISHTVTVGGMRSTSSESNGIGAEIANEVRSSNRAKSGREFKASTQALFDALDAKEGVTDDAKPNDTSQAAAAQGSAASSPAVTPPAAAAATPDAEKTTADAVAEHRARADRLAEHNRKLLGEVEALKKRPTKGEPSAREKALDEIERTWLENPVGAIQRMYALAMGVDDPKHKDVEGELAGLFKDLTEAQLGVPLDPTHKAQREAARTLRMIERERRERKSEQVAPAAVADQADPDAEQAAQMSAFIASTLPTIKHAEKFPLVNALAEHLDGKKPAELLWAVIKHGVGTGELDPRDPNDRLIEQASRIVEDHYDKLEAHHQALADRIRKARPSTSTAAPTQAADATATSADPAGQAVRTITNASASVAPATPPASKPPTGTAAEPTYKSEEERRAAILAKHFGKR